MKKGLSSIIAATLLFGTIGTVTASGSPAPSRIKRYILRDNVLFDSEMDVNKDFNVNIYDLIRYKQQLLVTEPDITTTELTTTESTTTATTTTATTTTVTTTAPPVTTTRATTTTTVPTTVATTTTTKSGEHFELDPNGTVYVLNTSTKKFHYESCRYVKKITAENLDYASNRNELIAHGYDACKVCNP